MKNNIIFPLYLISLGILPGIFLLANLGRNEQITRSCEIYSERRKGKKNNMFFNIFGAILFMCLPGIFVLIALLLNKDLMNIYKEVTKGTP